MSCLDFQFDDSDEEGSVMGDEEALEMQRQLESKVLDAGKSTQTEDRARQQGIQAAEVFYSLSVYFGTPDKLAEDDFSGMCARVGTGDYLVDSDVDVLDAKLASVSAVAESILDENRPPSKLDMRLFALLRATAQVTTAGNRQWEYGAEVRSQDLQLNSRLHDVLLRSPVVAGDNDAYQMAYLMEQRQLRGGRDGLLKLAAMNRQEKLGLLCAARPALAGSLNMEVVPGMLDGEMLRAGNSLCFDLFGDAEHSFGSACVARLYFSAASNRHALRRSLYSMCAFAGMARTGMIVECVHETRESGCSDVIAYSRLGASSAWRETEALVKALHAVCATRCAAHTLTSDTNASISALYAAFADWFDGCTHDDARFKAVQRAFSAACFTVGVVPDSLRALWTAHTAKAGVRCLCLWGAAEFLCSAALALKGRSIPLHAACLCVLSGAVGACCHENIHGPIVFTPSASIMIRQVYADVGKLQVADAQPSDKTPKYTPKLCGFSLPLKDMIHKDVVRLQNNKTKLTECHVRACLVHLARTEGWRALVGRLACIPSERNKQARRVFVRAMMAIPACAGSDCFYPSGQHFLSSQRDSEHAYKYNDVMGGALVVAILYPIASKALKEAVHSKFLQADSLPPQEQKKFGLPTLECLDEFLSQLSDLAEVVFKAQTRLTQPAPPRFERIKNLKWAELVFQQQICFIQAFSKAVRGAPTVFSRICSATSRHVRRLSDDDDEWEDCPAHPKASSSADMHVDIDFDASMHSLYA